MVKILKHWLVQGRDKETRKIVMISLLSTIFKLSITSERLVINNRPVFL